MTRTFLLVGATCLMPVCCGGGTADSSATNTPAPESESGGTTEGPQPQDAAPPDGTHGLVLRGTIEHVGIASDSPDPMRNWVVVLGDVEVVANDAGVETGAWNLDAGFSFFIHSPAKTFMHAGQAENLVGRRIQVGFHLPQEGATEWVPDEYGGIELIDD